MKPLYESLPEIEIDALIAEKVMGLAITTDPDEAAERQIMFRDSNLTVWYAGGVSIFSPRTDIKLAFVAASHLRDRDMVLSQCAEGWLCVMNASDDPSDIVFTPQLGGRAYTEHRRRVQAVHADPATAICLAALLAVGAVESGTTGGGA